MANDKKSGSTFFGRLLRDTRANTLAIGAAAVVPLVAMIGGGVDMSRAYLVKTQLQQACDAATLAARKKLSGNKVTNGVIPSDIEEIADNFFNANFAEGTYGTQARSFTLTAGTETRMDGEAAVNVPTTLMQVFNFESIPLSVECSAELNLPNIDVMLVLDNSGSMAGTPIAELKEAVLSFYDEIMAVKPAGARVRFGIVPYNASVNVGALLYAKNPDFLVSNREYQSRESNFELVNNNDGIDVGDILHEGSFRGPVPQNPNDLQPKNNVNYRWDRRIGDPEDDCNDYDGTYVIGDYTYITSNDDWYPSYYGSGNSNQRGACLLNVTYRKYATAADAKPDTYKNVFKNYTYRPRDIDTSVFKTFASATAYGVGDKGANITSTWNGCIEERATVWDDTFYPIPDEALDLDIDLVPDPADPDTQWRPQWRQITFDRDLARHWTTTTDRNSMGYNCPNASMKLTEFPLSGGSRNSTFETYVNNLGASGNTMHTIGMIWGARLLSETGIFGDENSTAPNGDPIVRHLIFMTDGAMVVNADIQTAYGAPDMDGRFGGFAPDGTWSQAQLSNAHETRLDAICARIKNQNTTVWTVSFRLDLSDRIRDCASGAQRAFEAEDSDALTDAFRKIASSIAELRLVN
ncbi:TadE/TadG family type IV pilus assembly protein [Allopontixanthobacter sediminis]|nr:TadE/TadG family type IV pilus assembly protein [Allopontixanthobacter sediminis]